MICRLYRKDAAIQGATGLVHAVAETENDEDRDLGRAALGPRDRQADQRRRPGRARLGHPRGARARLGLRGERRRGEVAAREARQGEGRADHDPPGHARRGAQGDAAGDALLAARAARHRGRVEKNGKEKAAAWSRSRASRSSTASAGPPSTRQADSGYVSAWYLDEDYDGDCFVDCQMFFDFKKTPNIKAALKAEVDPEEFTLKLDSRAVPGARLQAHRGEGRGRVRQRVHRRRETWRKGRRDGLRCRSRRHLRRLPGAGQALPASAGGRSKLRREAPALDAVPRLGEGREGRHRRRRRQGGGALRGPARHQPSS